MDKAQRKQANIRLIILYAVTVPLIYGSFWLGYYFLDNWLGLLTGIIVGGVLPAFLLIFLLIYKRSFWPAAASCLCASIGIGLAVSTFFVKLQIEASRFFGLVLLIMLAYKILQTLLVSRIRYKVFCTVLFVICEIIACVMFFVRYGSDPGLYSQIGFAFLIGIFLSFGQLALFKSGANGFWRTIALSYILGFVFIAVIVIILVISVLSEDGSGFEILGEITFGSIDSPSPKKRRKL